MDTSAKLSPQMTSVQTLCDLAPLREIWSRKDAKTRISAIEVLYSVLEVK